MQAIIKLGKSQYLVIPGQEITVDRLHRAPGVNFQITETLLLANGPDIQIGKPYVPNANVTASVVEHFTGDKIRVATFKAKSRYRKTKGFKAALSKVKIVEISAAPRPRKPVQARVKRAA